MLSATPSGSPSAPLQNTPPWPTHHPVLPSASAIASIHRRYLGNDNSLPPRDAGSSNRKSPASFSAFASKGGNSPRLEICPPQVRIRSAKPRAKSSCGKSVRWLSTLNFERSQNTHRFWHPIIRRMLNALVRTGALVHRRQKTTEHIDLHFIRSQPGKQSTQPGHQLARVFRIMETHIDQGLF